MHRFIVAFMPAFGAELERQFANLGEKDGRPIRDFEATRLPRGCVLIFAKVLRSTPRNCRWMTCASWISASTRSAGTLANRAESIRSNTSSSSTDGLRAAAFRIFADPDRTKSVLLC